MADLAVWQRTIVDEEGNVIPGAEIEVRREEDDSLATLYADRAGETPLANPLAADMSGFVRFFAQGDAYTITAVGAGSTRTWRFDPTGRLQEFDRVSEALNADGGADIVSARANLGTFSTVADVENAEIAPVLESIRTFGRDTPGDGGGAEYYRKLAPEVDRPGDIVDMGGGRFGLAPQTLRPHMLGAKGDGSDETELLQGLNDVAAFLGSPIEWAGEMRRYTIKETVGLQIPEGVQWIGTARFRFDGSGDVTHTALTVGKRADVEGVDVTTPGGNAIHNAITLHEGSKVGVIKVHAEAEVGNTFIHTEGQDVEIGEIRTVNCTRPLAVTGPEGSFSTGLKVGSIDVSGYIRGVSLARVQRFTIGEFHFRGRATNAAVSPGHNGFLFNPGVAYGYIGGGTIEDCGEHAIRLGGGEPGVVSKHITFGDIRVIRSGGCAFKLAPGIGTIEHIRVGRLIGVDVGEGSGGGNKELVRLSHCSNISFASLEASREQHPYSCRSVIRLNNVNNIHVGGVYAQGVATSVIDVDQNSDLGGENQGGPVTGLYIDSLNVTGPGGLSSPVGSVIRFISPDHGIGDIYIRNVVSIGAGSAFVNFGSGAPILGPVQISGSVISDTAPGYNNIPDDDRVWMDIYWNNGGRSVGWPGRFGKQSGWALNLPALDPGNVGKGGDFLLIPRDLQGGQGTLGPAISWTRTGSARRGASIAAMQTGANAQDMGLAFYAGANNTGTDALIQRAILDHHGDLVFSLNNRGPVIRSPNGTAYRIAVSDAGEISAVAI